MKPYISVIIPVHNGVRFLKKTIKGILSQTMKNIEVLLIENGSSDSSYEMCQKLAQENPNVFAYQSTEKGTSLARKKGVELAGGEYIVFSDQDDSYTSKHALQKMYDAIKQDGTQICQFGKYYIYSFGMRRKIRVTSCNQIIVRDGAYADAVSGAAGVSGSSFDCCVWSKIFETSCLKKAVEPISQSLLFAEDLNLNIHAFFQSDVQRVSVRAEEYYAWKVGVGFSSNPKNFYRLFEEYNTVKLRAIRLLEENGCSKQTLFRSYLESIYFLKAYVHGLISAKVEEKEILEEIAKMSEFAHVVAAKKYFRSLNSEELYDELIFLISDYTAEEYLQWCMTHTPRENIIKRIARFLLRH